MSGGPESRTSGASSIPNGFGDGAPIDREMTKQPLWWSLIKLARPKQWAKGVFVLIGPLYGLADGSVPVSRSLWGAAAALIAFSLVSSACYVVNDVFDAEQDRKHPRKRRRPIASGAVSPGQAWLFGCVLLLAAAAALIPLPAGAGLWTAVTLVLYAANVVAYSALTKHIVIADVVGLSLGFVLRVLGGCAAVGIGPTTWLLNVTFFLAMFLAFGKRLGERKSLGEHAVQTRGVQAGYTDQMLRLSVVVTAVVSLVTYAAYVQAQEAKYFLGFNLLWLTILPATYGLLRCIVLLERGTYDDPTELASSDRPFQLAAAAFAALTLALMMARHGHWIGHVTQPPALTAPSPPPASA